MLVEAAAIAPWVEARLRWGTLADVVAWSGRASPRTTRPAFPTQRLERVSRLVGHAYDRLPMPSTCLRKSLVTARLLSRRGVSVRVRLGVRRSGPTLEAHAWVEAHGRAVADEQVAAFWPLSLPSEGRALTRNVRPWP